MRIHRQVRVECSPSVLWSYLFEDELIKKWVPSHVQGVPDDPGNLGVGSWATIYLKSGKKVEGFRSLTTQYKLGECVAVRVHGTFFDKELEWDLAYTLAATASDTMLGCDVNVPVGKYGLSSIIHGPLVWWSISKSLKRNFATLAALVRARSVGH